MSKLINTLIAAVLLAGLSANVFARSGDEAFDAAQPKAHGPHTVISLAQNDVTGVLE